MAGVGADKLRGDAHAPARFAHAALDDVAHAQFLADFFDIDGLAFVVEDRCARDDREGTPASEQCDDVLGNTFGKKFLIGVATEIGERQYRDRAAVVVPRRARYRHRAGAVERGRPLGDVSTNPVDADRSTDVLEAFRTQIVEIEIDLSRDPVVDDFRHIDAAGLGERLEPRCDVYTVAEDVVILDDDVVEVDPDAERKPPVW